MFPIARKLAAEGLGTAWLLAIVVGSGMMGETLSGGNTAIALLANALATAAGLIVLITLFGPVSGAHFNPLVTLAFAARREINLKLASGYVLVQLAGAIIGVFVAHAMFGESLLQFAARPREGAGLMLSEVVATFGLIGTLFGCLRFKPDFTPTAVGLYILSAYWFTATTSFANPAVTLARSLTDSFAGIAPASVPAFIVAQTTGAVAGFLIFNWLLKAPPAAPPARIEP
ncbi:MIP/aquaporin family protein [Asticcacaulis sp. AND118]|uniref:aquaporin n=1 Tax=Asticcacaulis sp. AND118 TaxID=2840468 RepID=UPI001CFFD7CE|nr:MIP/aquaporin family protein [Asticcacaulis sp. AND118]UDF04419.1 aquaporin family protein [Asticcacaulis sp. AND118]